MMFVNFIISGLISSFLVAGALKKSANATLTSTESGGFQLAQLPYFVKYIGLALVILAILFYSLANGEQPAITESLRLAVVITGLILITISKEKKELRLYNQLRLLAFFSSSLVLMFIYSIYITIFSDGISAVSVPQFLIAMLLLHIATFYVSKWNKNIGK